MSNYQSDDSALKASGRFGRLSYLGWSFLSTLVFFVILVVAVVVLVGTNPESIASISTFAIIVFVIIYIAFFYFTIIFAVRRLHDLNQSGWLWLLFLVPLANIGLALYLLFAAGTQGPNNYGAPRPTAGWEKVMAWMNILIIPLFGILAAISIPAYQSYVERAQKQQFEQLLEQQNQQYQSK